MEIRNAQMEFAGGGPVAQALQLVKGPGVDARPLPAWGIHARNVAQLILEDVRLSVVPDDLRPVLHADQVKQLKLDGVKFTRVPGAKEPIITRKAESLRQSP